MNTKNKIKNDTSKFKDNFVALYMIKDLIRTDY